MNKIFKVIWNRTTQSLVVVSELAKGQVNHLLMLQRRQLLVELVKYLN